MQLGVFEAQEMTFGTRTSTVYTAGEGHGVLLMHEVPGLHPQVVDFASDLVDAGFTVWMPDLFGTAGKPVGVRYTLKTIAKVCISREFNVIRTGRNSPITDDLRVLARALSEHTQGPVGAVGMCLTGGFALALAVDPWLAAPVLSQPSLPFGVFPWQKRDLGIDANTLCKLKARVQDGVCVLGLRYRSDPMVPGARFKRLKDELGEGFESVELDGRITDHSVLAAHRHDPSVQHTIAFLRQHLQP